MYRIEVVRTEKPSRVVLAFLGNADLSFLGDLPDAEQWLNSMLRCYLMSFRCGRPA